MNTPRHIDSTFDRLVDISSVDEARRMTGEPTPDYSEFTVAAIEKRRARRLAHEENTELYRLTGDIRLSPEQIATNQLGAAACREVINQPKPQQ